ncbi:carbohydrate ABC transporter permease [Candidatus Leptofilum sp.]|uniref:carbohydrate ABC transporter permease n=1 Tax=Candidatus Leptofilum sp. TaxID=3241576 RepID=UPI003B58FBCE
MRKNSTRKMVMSLLQTTGILFIIFYILFPIYWIASTAFKTRRDAFSTRILFTPTFDNFTKLFDGNPYDFTPLIRNSVIIAFTTVVIAVPLAIMAAYAFSRYRFRGKNSLLILVLSAQFLPATVVLLPYFIQFRNLGLLDTLQGLIILNLAGAIPFGIWLVKGFIDSLPQEIEQAALVDGATEFQVLRYVTIPLIRPGIIVAVVFAFVGAWNEFLFAFIMTSSEKARPMMVGLLSLVEVQGVPWELMSAAGLIIMVPIFILAVAIREHFVGGLTMGAVK